MTDSVVEIARARPIAAEAERALHRLGASEDGRPEIVPVALEGPPIPPVPDALKSIHFNDPLVYVIAATAQDAGSLRRPN